MANSSVRRAADALETLSTNLGASLGRILTFDPAAAATFVNTVTANPSYTVGYKYIYASRTFMYTQFKDAVAYAAGHSCFHDASLGGVVTNDVSEAASASKPQVMGICLGVQTENYFGFVQTRGSGFVLHNNDDNAAIGDEIVATVADGGICDVLSTFGISALHVGIAEVAVVAATNLQQVSINIYGAW